MLAKRMLDEILMNLTGKYLSLDEFAERLRDRLIWQGLKNLQIKIDDEALCIAVFHPDDTPILYTFLSELSDEDRTVEGHQYGYVHAEYWVRPNPIIWNRDGLTKLEKILLSKK
ncbi:MAG: hypothetical protein ABGX27_09005 [Desulfurobacteriaceae bacterium]